MEDDDEAEDLGLDALGLPSGFKTTKRIRANNRSKRGERGESGQLERIAFDGQWDMNPSAYTNNQYELQQPHPQPGAFFNVGEKCACYWTGDGMMYPAIITRAHVLAQSLEPLYDLTFDFFLHKVEQVPQSWLCRLEDTDRSEGLWLSIKLEVSSLL